jgi:ubiquinone/menaquinone biosynthesis C-methylase UbiE
VPIDLDEYREKSLDAWNRFAPSWERERDFMVSTTRPVAERLVDRLDPQPGQTVLDIAAGTGDQGFLVAERVGDGGKLISTDFAPSMVEVARRVGERAGLGNVEYRVLNAERMDLEDDSVDGVLCRFGYMLMADPAAALAETRRVLRQGGRLSFAVWASPDRNLWAAIPGMTMVELGHLPPPEPGAPSIFAMADPDRVRSLVTGAGFAEPETEEVAVRWGYADADEHWDKTLALAVPIAEAFNSLDQDAQEKVKATVNERARERLAEDPGGLDGVVLTVLTS